MPGDDGLDRLRKIDHIVVLMMENRSFDQMLGYLALDGLDVEGLDKAKPNEDTEGNSYPVHEFDPDETSFIRLRTRPARSSIRATRRSA